jgi:hypothetical protein
MYWYRTLLICASVSVALALWLAMPRGVRKQWLLLGVLITSIWAVEFVGVLLTISEHSNSLLYNLAWPIFFTMLVALGHQLFPLKRIVLIVVFSLFALVHLINAIAFDMMAGILSYSIISGSLIVCALYFNALWHLVNHHPSRLTSSGVFWVSFSVVLYYGSLTPLLGTINYLNSHAPGVATELYWIVQIMASLHYLGLGIACVVERRRCTIQHAHAR